MPVAAALLLFADLPVHMVQALGIAAAQTGSSTPQCRCTQASSRAGLSSSRQRPLQVQSGWRCVRSACRSHTHATIG